MNIRLASEIITDSIVDGKGLRTVIWTQGCSHGCKGCHNPQTHDFNDGFLKNTDDLVFEILEVTLMSPSVTFSGGDPFEQPKECAYIAKKLKEKGFDIWAYTGYKFEDIMYDTDKREFLKELDVLVDGPFILSEKNLTLPFRGSNNQRILDVQKSLLFRKAKWLLEYEVDIKDNHIAITLA